MKVLFYDTETSGLKPGQIGQLSIIECNEQGQFGHNYYFCIDEISDGAAKVTGRDLDFYRKASNGIRFEHKAAELAELFKYATVIGHNVKFDNMFMRAELHRCGIEFTYAKEFDTMNYFKDICKLKGNRFGYKNPKLEEVIKFLGINEEKVRKFTEQMFKLNNSSYHDATYDTTAMYTAYMVQTGLSNGDRSWADVFCD